MTGPPPPGAAGGGAEPSDAGGARRRPGRRTFGRDELARHDRFEEISPEVGELDVDALQRAMADEPDDVLTLLMKLRRATDPALRARAQAIAPRLVLDHARQGLDAARGTGVLRPSTADRGGDVDLDASLEELVQARAERRLTRPEELASRVWARPETALCLLVDRSGSMDGHQLATASMAAAACALRARGELAVVAFGSSVEVLATLGQEVRPETVVEQVLALTGHGITTLSGALRAAGSQLHRARARRRVTLLLSDCRATDDVDPVPAALALEELCILAPAEDRDEADDLARAAGARVVPVTDIGGLPAALEQVLRERA
jgi:Mg-chelatase subunit ChlD